MLKSIIFTSITLGVLVLSGHATAACSIGNGWRETGTRGLMGKTICISNGSGWEAQEYIASDFKVIDYKRGPTDPVDPSAQVGTWSAGTGNIINYDYGQGGTFSYQVYTNGSAIDFCQAGSSVVSGTFKLGQVAC